MAGSLCGQGKQSWGISPQGSFTNGNCNANKYTCFSAMRATQASCFLFRVLLIAAVILSSSVCHQGVVFAEEECINKGILCYTCDSTQDPKCADPWNYTELYDIGIPVETCMGCCVKIVTYNMTSSSGSPGGRPQRLTNVRRTCTTTLQINLFLVDHVCMHESEGNGHMCFCESDMCNAAPLSAPLLLGLRPRHADGGKEHRLHSFLRTVVACLMALLLHACLANHLLGLNRIDMAASHADSNITVEKIEDDMDTGSTSSEEELLTCLMSWPSLGSALPLQRQLQGGLAEIRTTTKIQSKAGVVVAHRCRNKSNYFKAAETDNKHCVNGSNTVSNHSITDNNFNNDNEVITDNDCRCWSSCCQSEPLSMLYFLSIASPRHWRRVRRHLSRGPTLPIHQTLRRRPQRLRPFYCADRAVSKGLPCVAFNALCRAIVRADKTVTHKQEEDDGGDNDVSKLIISTTLLVIASAPIVINEYIMMATDVNDTAEWILRSLVDAVPRFIVCCGNPVSEKEPHPDKSKYGWDKSPVELKRDFRKEFRVSIVQPIDRSNGELHKDPHCKGVEEDVQVLNDDCRCRFFPGLELREQPLLNDYYHCCSCSTKLRERSETIAEGEGHYVGDESARGYPEYVSVFRATGQAATAITTTPDSNKYHSDDDPIVSGHNTKRTNEQELKTESQNLSFTEKICPSANRGYSDDDLSINKTATTSTTTTLSTIIHRQQYLQWSIEQQQQQGMEASTSVICCYRCDNCGINIIIMTTTDVDHHKDTQKSLSVVVPSSSWQPLPKAQQFSHDNIHGCAVQTPKPSSLSRPPPPSSSSSSMSSLSASCSSSPIQHLSSISLSYVKVSLIKPSPFTLTTTTTTTTNPTATTTPTIRAQINHQHYHVQDCCKDFVIIKDNSSTTKATRNTTAVGIIATTTNTTTEETAAAAAMIMIKAACTTTTATITTNDDDSNNNIPLTNPVTSTNANSTATLIRTTTVNGNTTKIQPAATTIVTTDTSLYTNNTESNSTVKYSHCSHHQKQVFGDLPLSRHQQQQQQEEESDITRIPSGCRRNGGHQTAKIQLTTPLLQILEDSKQSLFCQLDSKKIQSAHVRMPCDVAHVPNGSVVLCGRSDIAVDGCRQYLYSIRLVVNHHG